MVGVKRLFHCAINWKIACVVYVGLTVTVLPLIIAYLILSKYIVAGVALGGVKG